VRTRVREKFGREQGWAKINTRKMRLWVQQNFNIVQML